MNRGLAIALFASILALSAVSAQTQAPQRDTRQQTTPAPSGTGALSGMVVSAIDNAKLVRLAPVVIIGTSTGVLRVTSTDAAGRFSFVGLPADRYLVGASKPPFLGAVAGAKRPARPGVPIALADGQKITNITIQLQPGAAISGTVTDERGQPAPFVTVNALQPRLQNGERVLTSGPAAQTDDRGRYRIYGLPPGEYVVMANPRPGGPGMMGVRGLTDADVDAAMKAQQAQPGALVSAPGASLASASTPAAPPPPSVTYAPVFFPGTARASDAGAIMIAVGEDRQSVDFRLELVRTAKVEGTVSGADALQPSSLAVIVGTSMPTVGGIRSIARVLPDGRFSVANLPPGSYTLIANSQIVPTTQFGVTTIEVTGVDQSGIQLTLQPAPSFSAHIVFSGATPPPPVAGLRVPVRALPPTIPGAFSPLVLPANADGVFTVSGIAPGRYVIGGTPFFGATQASLTWALQSVVADGKDVTDLPVEIGAGAVPKDVVVTYSDKSQQLSGRLQQSGGAPATDYTIVLFPADKAYWIPGSRRILTTRAGTDGQFKLGGSGPIALPAGEYLMAAVGDIEKDEQFDPAFLAALQQNALKVTLAPGEKKIQNLSIR